MGRNQVAAARNKSYKCPPWPKGATDAAARNVRSKKYITTTKEERCAHATRPHPHRTPRTPPRHDSTPRKSVGQVRVRSKRAPWPPRIHSVSGRLDAAPPRRDTSTRGSVACGCPAGVPPASPPPGGGPSAPLPPPRRSAVGFGKTAKCRKPKSGVGQPVAQPCDSAATATHSRIPPSITTAPSRPPPAPPHPPLNPERYAHLTCTPRPARPPPRPGTATPRRAACPPQSPRP